MLFENRAEAGRLLAEELHGLITGPCVVGAVPRGGIVVGLPVARRVESPLAVLFAHKLSSPSWPELAFGALDEDGFSVLDEDTVRALDLDEAGIASACARTREAIRERIALYRAPRLEDFLPGRGVVIVDDGLATGLTVLAAVRYARRHGASEVVVAAPCASLEAAGSLSREADRVVSLVVDPGFRGVSQYYVDFSPVEDEEVIALLARERRRPGEAVGAGPSPEPGSTRVTRGGGES